MPTINAVMIIQLCVLVAAFSAQYLLSQWYRADSTQSLQVIERLIDYWNNFRCSYLGQNVWTRYLKHQMVKMRNWYNEDEEYIHAYFAEPTRIRSPRPESVQFKVGMVIMHKQLGYSGVIIGWDVEARAPEEWLKQRYPPEKQLCPTLCDPIWDFLGKNTGMVCHFLLQLILQMRKLRQTYLRKSPHYRILVNISNRIGISTVYIPEENLKVITGYEVIHPDLKVYFSKYDGAKYIMQPWLKQIYPHD